MARIKVYQDWDPETATQLPAVVEIEQDPGDGSYVAWCGHPDHMASTRDIVADTHERWSLADTIAEAERHIEHDH